jgi:hypothetical protein
MKNLIVLVLCAIVLLVATERCGTKIAAPSFLVAEYPDLKRYFDAGYVATVGFEDKAGTIPIVDGKPVRVIKDIIGDKDMTWLGPEVPSPMWKTPPVYHVEERAGAPSIGYILLQNVTNTKWQTKEFTPVAMPYDVYLVLRDTECVNFEGYFAAGLGLRNRGGQLEIKIDDFKGGQCQTTSLNMAPPTILAYNKIAIVRMRYDGANTKLFVNNVEVPFASTQPVEPTCNEFRPFTNEMIKLFGYGTISHAAQHDFFGIWLKFGTLSAADHATIYQTLSDFYKPNIYPDKPLANNIKAIWNNSTKAWDVQYEYVGTNPEDKTKTEYQWGYHLQGNRSIQPASGEDLDFSTFFDGPDGKSSSLIRSKFSNIFANSTVGPKYSEPGKNFVRVFVAVKVFDNKGNSWNHLTRSSFAGDNTP